MKWIIVVALLGACEPKEPIGQNDLDASMQVVGDGSPSQTCSSCDASSCGSRICGRSECGFPCGTCESPDFCLLGVSCGPITGTSIPCIDAFGDETSSLDVGFRTCPTDPSKQQSCQCDGATGNWINCDTACIEVCNPQFAADITCGSSTCSGGDVCCVPTNDTTAAACSAGKCGANNYTRSCDGPEDCGPGSVCCRGSSLWTATCRAGTSCGSDDDYCHTAADCPTSKPYCCPGITVPDMSTCSATDSPICL